MRNQTEEERINRERRYSEKSNSELRSEIIQYSEDVVKSTNLIEIQLKCSSIVYCESELLKRKNSDICEIEKRKEFIYNLQCEYVGIEFYDGEKYRVVFRRDHILQLIALANKVISLEDAKIIKNRYGGKYRDFVLAQEAYEWPILYDNSRYLK